MYEYRSNDKTLILNSTDDIFSFLRKSSQVVSSGTSQWILRSEPEHLICGKAFKPSKKQLPLNLLTLTGLKDIQVSDDNPDFKTIDEVIYTKDGTLLVFCPASKMGTINIAEGTQTIGKNAFTQCNISKVIIPDSVKVIDKCAFVECENLSEVKIGEKSHLERINASAFDGCKSLENFYFPESLKLLDNNAFSCAGIKKVFYPNDVTVGRDVFYHCPIEYVYVPKTNFADVPNLCIIEACQSFCYMNDVDIKELAYGFFTLQCEGYNPIIIPRYLDTDGKIRNMDAKIVRFHKENSKDGLDLFKFGAAPECKEATAIAEYKAYHSEAAKCFLVRNSAQIARRRAAVNEETLYDFVSMDIWKTTALKKMLAIAEDFNYASVITYILEKLPKKKIQRIKL